MEHEGMGASHAGVETGAAELRAGLTSLLQEHVYLAGAAISTAVQAGGDMEAPAVVSAVATPDANSVALSEAISSVSGEEGGATLDRKSDGEEKRGEITVDRGG